MGGNPQKIGGGGVTSLPHFLRSVSEHKIFVPKKYLFGMPKRYM
jgi:hypothetical protein